VPNRLLAGGEIASVVAYNLGTSVSRQGDLDVGTMLLEQAVRLGFPFDEGPKNLCLNYYRRQQFDQVIRVAEACLGYHLSSTSSRVYPSSGERMCEPTAHRVPGGYSFNPSSQVDYDLQRVFFRALLQVGRRDEAFVVAQRILSSPTVGQQDFEIYRFYLETKSTRDHPSR
jgi:hypothetical protein